MVQCARPTDASVNNGCGGAAWGRDSGGDGGGRKATRGLISYQRGSDKREDGLEQ